MKELDDKILQNVGRLKEYLVSKRRYLHENPELSEHEVKTAKFLKEELADLEFEIIDTEGSEGFIAILDTKRPGKTVGLRADIDALPVQENEKNLKNNRCTVSKNEGVMHACGHDAHMAMNLAAARVLSQMKEDLSGRVIFIFEAAEENGAGIEPMIRLLKNYEIDAIYGAHVSILLETGEVSMDPGPVMTGFYAFDFDVVGKGGHGSRPDLSISPIFAASNIVINLGNVWVNQLDVTKTVTLGLGSIRGGDAPNVIPDRVKINGSLRFFDVEEGKKARSLLQRTAKLTAEIHNCSIEFVASSLGNPVINHRELAKRAQNGIEEILPGALKKEVIWFASESFNQYQNIAPSVFAFIGMKNETVGSGAEHHNEYFDLDEQSMYYGAVSAVKFAIDTLNS